MSVMHSGWPFDDSAPTLGHAQATHEAEEGIEQALQDLALKKYGVRIKAAVFRRVKRHRHHLLALVRLDHPAPGLTDPECFVTELVNDYNEQAAQALLRPLTCAVWNSQEHYTHHVSTRASIILATT